MDIRSLARIDMNLLITLAILLQEKSVSRAAERLYLTQPAISKSLSRLRDIFNDPLFIRSGRGLVTTPFAESLHEPLEHILAGVSDLFIADAFDPASYNGSFNLAVNEFMDMALVPMLVADLSQLAPGIHLNTFTQMEHQLLALEKGELDFVLNLKFSNIPEHFHSELLLEDSPSLFVRKGHPLEKKKKLAFADLVAYPRVALNMPDMDKLSMFSRTRNGPSPAWPSIFDTENLITALAVIAGTDYVLPGPGLMKHFATRELVFTALDFAAGPGFRIEYCLVSHERVANSAAHQWLRERIMTLAGQLKL